MLYQRELLIICSENAQNSFSYTYTYKHTPYNVITTSDSQGQSVFFSLEPPFSSYRHTETGSRNVPIMPLTPKVTGASYTSYKTTSEFQSSMCFAV